MAAELTSESQEWKPKYGPWLGAIPTIFAAFMFVLDETIANVALPHMAGSFSISRDESMWILTLYLVASGVVIPMVDWFCKIMGRKLFFILSGYFMFRYIPVIQEGNITLSEWWKKRAVRLLPMSAITVVVFEIILFINNTMFGTNNPSASRTVVKAAKIGRNDPCPCGSGKKYKHCCGKDN